LGVSVSARLRAATSASIAAGRKHDRAHVTRGCAVANGSRDRRPSHPLDSPSNQDRAERDPG
jgi:hypothetical protein